MFHHTPADVVQTNYQPKYYNLTLSYFLRCSIHRTFHYPVKGWLCLTNPITLPYVLPAAVHLIMEVMIYRDIQPSDRVYFRHHFQEKWPMTLVDPTWLGVCNEEVCVDHLVQKGLLELIVRPEFQEGLRKRDRARFLPLVFASSRA